MEISNHQYPLLSQTNRQFYSRKKKGFQLRYNPTVQVEKTLKLILNKKLNNRKLEHCKTEKSE